MINLDGITFVKGSLRYQASPEVGISTTVSLSNTQKELEEYQRQITISLADVYDKERQKSTLFIPSCKFQFLFSNAYYGRVQTPSSPYEPFNNNLAYYKAEETKLLQLENDTQIIAWPGFPQYTEFCFIRTDYDTRGYTAGLENHIEMKAKDVTFYNWYIHLTYPYDNDENRFLYYEFPSTNFSWQIKDGLPYQMTKVTNGDKTLWQFTCPMNHNLNDNQYVYLPYVKIFDSVGNEVPSNQIYKIYSLGNGFYDSEKKIFNILDIGYNEQPLSFYSGATGVFKRVLDIDNPNETMSKYYVRRHRFLTNSGDTVLTNSGFEQNAFRTTKKFESRDLTPNQESRVSIKEDSQSYNVSFSKNINLGGLIDNQQRPISEIYFTVINRGYFGYFNPPTLQGNAIKEGWGINLTTISNYWWTRSNISSDLNLSTSYYSKLGFDFYYNNAYSEGDIINGPICEWNDFEQNEYEISNYYHKLVFNPQVFNISTSIDNPLGYYYNPHFKMRIKEYSDYIEEGNPATSDSYPSYSYYSQNNDTLYWRDIYPYGFLDTDGNGVDYPFFNNRHYPYENFVFRLIPEGTNVEPSNIDVELPNLDECE
jgi:hypothetical protein